MPHCCSVHNRWREPFKGKAKHTHVQKRTRACTHAHTCTCVRTHTHTHTHARTCTGHTHTHMHMYTHVTKNKTPQRVSPRKDTKWKLKTSGTRKGGRKNQPSRPSRAVSKRSGVPCTQAGAQTRALLPLEARQQMLRRKEWCRVHLCSVQAARNGSL